VQTREDRERAELVGGDRELPGTRLALQVFQQAHRDVGRFDGVEALVHDLRLDS
jgi:hypothetical protein